LNARGAGYAAFLVGDEEEPAQEFVPQPGEAKLTVGGVPFAFDPDPVFEPGGNLQ